MKKNSGSDSDSDFEPQSKKLKTGDQARSPIVLPSPSDEKEEKTPPIILPSSSDEEEKKTPETSPSSKDTTPSPVMVEGKAGTSANPMTGDVALSALRGRTVIGTQGEHVSAYLLYEELIYTAIEDTTFSEAANALKEGFSCLLLDKKAVQEVGELIEKMKTDTNTSVIPRETRQGITRSIRGANYLATHKDYLSKLVEAREQAHDCMPQERETIAEIKKGLERIITTKYEPVKEAIRNSNRMQYAPFVAEFIDIYLHGANKMTYVSFPSEGMPNNPHSKKERGAKNRLKEFNQLLQWIEEIKTISTDVKKKERIKDILEDNATMIDNMKNTWGIPEVTIKKLLRGESLIEDIILKQNLTDKLVKHMSQLFWHPYIDQPLSPNDPEWQKIQQKVPPKYNKGTLPRDNNLEVLFHVAGRHVVLIMQCFKGLQCLSPDMQNKIIDAFLAEIIDNQNWNKEKTAAGASLIVPVLRSEIDMLITVTPEEKSYYMVGSEKDKQLSMAQGTHTITKM